MQTGTVVGKVLALLHNEVQTYPFDIVLVCRDRPTLAIAQSWRLQHDATGVGPSATEKPTLRAFSDLNLHPDLRSYAMDLASEALKGNLALFLGAGASVGAGLPTWHSLLNSIWEEHMEFSPSSSSAVDSNTHASFAEFRALGPLEKADWLQQNMGGGVEGKASLGSAVVSRLMSPYVSLTHMLLAGLPTDAVITTNYDQLYEQACMSRNEMSGRGAQLHTGAGKTGTGTTTNASKARAEKKQHQQQAAADEDALDNMQLSVIPYAPLRYNISILHYHTVWHSTARR